MPKGVEHKAGRQYGTGLLVVELSKMPKGVEHPAGNVAGKILTR